MGKYQHLTQEERDKLAVLRSKGWTLRDIGEAVGRDPGTLSRELKRNGPRGLYLPHKAHERAEQRHKESHKHKRLKTYTIRHEVEQMLLKGWSPELIAGRLKLSNGRQTISYESIYQWIYAEAPYLAHYLTRTHKTRFPKNHARNKRAIRIPCRVSITQRPAVIESREQAGHWEADLMASHQSSAALEVCVERTSRLARLTKIKNKSAQASRQALQGMLEQYPASLRRSITYDNGTENAEHGQLNEAIGTCSYFCEPYHSWEKGTVENTNGIIRRFLPKKTDLATIPTDRIQEIELWLNNRPRKCLGYRTAAEAFDAFVALTP